VDDQNPANDTPSDQYGNDIIAGGPDNDEIFGQLGEDIIQGDGQVLLSLPGAEPVDSDAWRDANGLLNIIPSQERISDGDDYIEGNGGSDVIFGNLGQDDIIGGNSDLFGLNLQKDRWDTSDIIFGGAAYTEDLERNSLGDATWTDGEGSLIVNDANSHSRDADYILGDNGNIYRLVEIVDAQGTTQYLTFNYDIGVDFDGTDRGGLRVVVRGNEWIGDDETGAQDYTPGGADYDAPNTVNNLGAADEIHGEAGDDVIYGMVGDDVLFGDGQDDDLYGGYGHDWISGGTGQDGVLGDDGRIYTSRNSTEGESLYGVAGFTAAELNLEISTPGGFQQAVLNVEGALKKTVNLTPFNVAGPADVASMGDDVVLYDAQYANDIIFGGWGSDFLHGGSGDDAISGAEALPQYFAKPFNPGDYLAWGEVAGREVEFAAYDENDPKSKVYVTPNADGVLVFSQTGDEFILNFNHLEGPQDLYADGVNYDPVATDGDDIIFGDLGNDWLVGGTGRDTTYGGFGDDLMNVDDNLETNGGLNDIPDTHPSYEDRAYGGAGRDIMIANTGGDRLIDWAGEFNSYLVPFAPFGMATVSRSIMPALQEFLYDLSESHGADPTRATDENTDPDRNGEPLGELGLITQQDWAWQDQTGSPDDPQPGNIGGGSRDVRIDADSGASGGGGGGTAGSGGGSGGNDNGGGSGGNAGGNGNGNAGGNGKGKK
jgi:Ca2+-binding RTX toxin-like protein